MRKGFLSLVIGLLLVFSNSVPGLAKARSPEALLEKLVNINSGSRNKRGILRIQKIVDKKLKKLGFKTEMFKSSDPQYKGYPLLVGEIKGQKNEFITLVTHADTVFEPNSGFKKFKKTSDGKKATGPGTIDDKGGMVVALEGVKEFLKNTKGTLTYSLRFIVSPSEEVGSPGFQQKLKEFSKDSKVVLGFEPSLEDGSIIESRRGNRWYLVKITGREAHAGRGHKTGINACHELASKIAKLRKLTNYRKDVTLSVGHIEGGKDKYNIVCGHAKAKIDTRFSTIKDGKKLDKKIRRILDKPITCAASDKQCAQTTIKIIDDAPPFSLTRVSKKYVKKYLSLVSKIENKEITAKKSGGAADTNYLSREGLAVIDGLGAVGGKIHTKDEFIDLSSLNTRSKALSEFLIYIFTN